MNKLDSEMNKVKFRAFGKITYSNKPKTYNALKAQEREKEQIKHFSKGIVRMSL